jgi:single-stranded DNA-binding protein
MSSSTISRSIIFGRLGADPTFKRIGENAYAVNFRLATDHRFKRNGEEIEHTEWHVVKTVITSNQLPMFKDRLKKGRMVLVEGPRITDAVQREDGSTQYYAAIRAYPEDIVLPDGEPHHREEPQGVEVEGYEIPLRGEHAQQPAPRRPPPPPRREVHRHTERPAGRNASGNNRDALSFDD